ncbi:MAG: N-acetylmuramoyl-L-alanine amidase [Marinovum sp.]|nr:N-acetylmuramoyl-L-alanine amidase [Marinovum sp.]
MGRGLLRFTFLMMLSLALWAPGAFAQAFGAQARAMQDGSEIRDPWIGPVQFDLALSTGVPWRVFTVAKPNRLVLDFREVDFRSFDLGAFDQSDAVKGAYAGPLRAGWSRMVLELNVPLDVETAELRVVEEGSRAQLTLALREVEQVTFDASAGVPDDPNWVVDGPIILGEPAPLPDVFTVVLDPGHGGIDPGAMRQGFRESDIVLQLALELEEVLIRSGNVRVVLTRRADDFVSLERRIAIAAQAGAHAFVSLHADALAQGVAHGASVYALSDSAMDEAGIALVERHERGELLAGIDLSGADDEVARTLIDLARQDSAQRSDMLAQAVVGGIQNSGVRMHKRPLQSAGFSVLKSADIPSILVEAGFLSTGAELERLNDPVWRGVLVEGIRDGLMAWSLADRAVAPLRRK